MLDELQPAIRFAIMSILAALYESGIVEEVDLSDVMRLFGVTPPESVSTKFSFSDEGWIEAYIEFREGDAIEFDFESFGETTKTAEELESILDLVDWQPNGKSN